MLSRKKRDAKFLIFQSLYIIAIAILFYKGTDLSLNHVEEIKPGTINIDTAKIKVYDPLDVEVLPKLPKDSSKYQSVSTNDSIVNRQTLKEKDKRISDLEKIKTPEKTTIRTIPQKNDNGQTIDDKYGRKVPR